MAHEFRCADAGATTCNGHFEASSEEELLAKVTQHLQDTHNVQHVTNTLRNYAREVATSS